MSYDDDSDEHYGHRHNTPVRTLAVIDSELQGAIHRIDTLERHHRQFDKWKAAVGGAEGQKGSLAQLNEEVDDVRATTVQHHDRITKVEHFTFKIVAAAGLAAMFGGAIVEIAFHLWGK